jgi:hypothetical protein
MTVYLHKVTHISFRESFTDKFETEAGARSSFDECRKSPAIIFASLHINSRLIATYENTDDLELDMGRFGP